MNAIPSRVALVGIAVAAAVSVAACSTSPDSSNTVDGSSAPSKGAPGSGGARSGGKTIQVVAAENFWGSIASQLGGGHVKVTSVIDSPSADPHDYEPTAADARTVAGAQLTIVNGVGYDSWAGKLLAASPGQSRTDLEVGKLVGIPANGNPHRWYSPDDVHQVIERITADYKKLDPADSADFDSLKNTFENTTLAPYTKEIADIKRAYAGTPVGASESIFAPLAEGLGLRLVTPESFLDAISEGTDPTAKDKSLIDRQIADRQIKVYVYNSQNATPDVQAQVKAARAEGIPVATVTETLTPAGASFQDWQVRQLKGIRAALAKAAAK